MICKPTPSRGRFAALILASLVAAAGCADAEPEANSAPAAVVVAQNPAGDAAAPSDAVATTTAASRNDPRADAPPQIRGLYLNAYAAGSRNRLPKLIAIADSTEINAFVVDVKSERGVHYTSQIALAQQLQQEGENTLRDLSAFVDTLHAHDIYAIARIVLFKDPLLSKAKPEWSVRKPGGGLWEDKAGNTWVSPWDENVWDYNLQIAEEAAKAGFDEIQFDYVRFAEPYKSLPAQIHPKAKGDRTDAIAAFLNEAKRRIHPLGATVTADVFGLSPNDPRDVNIGQQWETISATADHILPMMYPSHYLPTHLPGVPKPNTMPYETIYKSAGMAKLRSDRLEAAGVKPARVIPWLQAFNAPWITKNYPYGVEQARAQIRGVYDVGFEDWVFWHPGSKYEPVMGAFERTTQSHAKAYEPPADVRSVVDQFEAQGIREARERAAAQARGRTTDAAAATAAKAGEQTPAATGGTR